MFSIRVRGRAEIRDEGALVDVGTSSADAWTLPAARVLAINELAQALTSTGSLAEAERLTEAICGRSELTYERRKARSAQQERPLTLSDAELASRVSQFLHDARARGADLVTYRRITDAIGSRAYEPDRLRAALGPLSLNRLAIAATGAQLSELNSQPQSAPR
jgi:hypothetical protein